jgi:hypothetical protein
VAAVDLVPPAATCDFEVGTIEWSLAYYGQPQAHVVLRDLAGSSPLCTNGTYHLEATLRVTGKACGDALDQVRCTVTDQTISAPFVVVGRKADTTVTLPLGPLGKYPETAIDNVGLLDVRLIDPTGATFAVPGVTGVRSLVGLRVDIKATACASGAPSPSARSRPPSTRPSKAARRSRSATATVRSTRSPSRRRAGRIRPRSGHAGPTSIRAASSPACEKPASSATASPRR